MNLYLNSLRITEKQFFFREKFDVLGGLYGWAKKQMKIIYQELSFARRLINMVEKYIYLRILLGVVKLTLLDFTIRKL